MAVNQIAIQKGRNRFSIKCHCPLAIDYWCDVRSGRRGSCLLWLPIDNTHTHTHRHMPTATNKKK